MCAARLSSSTRGGRTFVASLLLAALCLACCYLPGPSGSSGPPSPPPPPPAPTPVLDALGAQLRTGVVWGGTPDAIRIATSVSDWPLDAEDGVVAEVVPGPITRINVLVEIYDDGYEALPDMDDATRRGLLNDLADDVRGEWYAGDYHLCIAIRGSIFYGAMLSQSPGVAPVYTTEFAIDEHAVDRCLSGL